VMEEITASHDSEYNFEVLIIDIKLLV